MAVERLEEEEYLEGLKGELEKEAEKLRKKMDSYSENCMEAAKYMWENRSEFDEFGYEAYNNRVAVEQLADSGEQAREQFRRIVKMLDSPYFSRIDFREEGEAEDFKVYIGKFPFWGGKGIYEVYDWRSPVASMYYEFENGPAFYDAPMGRIYGEITCKRQYKIRKGILEYVLESGLNINDEILQQELARTSDRKMKDIVATIQKEQNRLIRNESADVLIVQGVAGSGKTSIALHRVAYFLYRYKNEISADNFLIISPNGVFVDYISDVLPELGEARVRNMDMEDIAGAFLGGVSYERLCGQAERFLLAGDDDWAKRCRFKSTSRFLEQLEEFLGHCDEHLFSAEDYVYEKGVVEGDFISGCYRKLKAFPVRRRLREVAGAIWEEIRSRNKAWPGGVRKIEIEEWVTEHFRYTEALDVYREFYRYIGREDMFYRNDGEPLESADVFPLLYIKLYLEGCPENREIRHLIVDEMQDYTPVQYAVINQLYPCRKTILGDFSQNVVPFAQGSLSFLREVYPHAQVVEMKKSYRSTLEIMEFAGKICGDTSMEPVRRHGEEPETVRCADGQEEREKLLEMVKDFYGSAEGCGGGKMGIICKSYARAEELYWWLAARLPGEGGIHLFTYDSKEFYDGVMVTSVSMSKGLEFDRVAVPDVDAAEYKSGYDRGLLYVACTRAMHKLTLLYCGEISGLLGTV